MTRDLGASHCYPALWYLERMMNKYMSEEYDRISGDPLAMASPGDVQVKSEALSDLIETLNQSLEKVIREAISVAIGEALLLLREKGILKDD